MSFVQPRSKINFSDLKIKNPVDFSDLNPDPLEQISIWLREAEQVGFHQPEAMALATLDRVRLIPSVRIVLFKGLNQGALSFYTNYEGRKARDIESCSQVSAVFHWSEMERQIRIEGTVLKMSRQQNEAYFKTRPRLSQIGAWASHQSNRLEKREKLIEAIQAYSEKFKDQEVPCPPNWGGYLLTPSLIEFWQGHEGRLHDRLVFEKLSNARDWSTYRLSP